MSANFYLNMKYIFPNILLFLSVFFLASCSDSNDEPGKGSGEFLVGKTELAYSREGGSQEINVRSSVEPRVSVDASWVTYSVARRGTVDIYTVTVNVAANDADFDDRTAAMTVTDGSSTATVNIKQTYALGLELKSVSSTEIDGEGGSVTVTVAANGTYSVDAPAWAKLVDDSRALASETFELEIAPNRSGAVREGTVTVALDGTDVKVSFTLTQGKAAPLASMTAKEIADQFVMGINIGNTLEAIGGETAWGAARINEAYIHSIKESGFNFVRLPVAWYNHCDKSTLKIDETWMSRVKEVVDLLVSHDLYVVMNIHWDEGWMELNIDSYSEEVDNIQRTLWTQIAENFKDYDAHLIFAGANEAGKDSQSSADALKAYMQTFIDVVRASGGNNPERVLVVQAPSTNFDLAVKYCKNLPTDVTPDRLMLEVHYYDPSDFCIMSKDNEWGNNLPVKHFWGKDYHTGTNRDCTWGEEDYLDGKMAMMKTNFVDRGIPVIIGEFGATRRSGIDNLQKHLDSRAYYHGYLVKSARRNGLMPFYWDTPSDMFNRATGAVIDRQNLDAMIEAAR